MRAASMNQQQPLTPPVGEQELPFSLHHLAKHNAEQGYVTSRPSSMYGSPIQQNSHYSPAQFHSHLQNPLVELDSHIDVFGDQEASPYPALAGSTYQMPPCPHPSSQASPATPMSTNGSEAGSRHGEEYGMAMRSHLDQSRNHFAPSPSRTSSPQAEDETFRPKLQPKPKRSKASSKELPRTPRLTAALSILTAAFTDVPVKDMDAWVNRPASERHKEAEKRNGYVSRPMNCFMLYRSAYQERTKHWCVQNNHQVVSAVTGASWPMEPQEVQDYYKELARIERQNHQVAFPNYKFSPSKAGAAPRKRKKDSFDLSHSGMDGISKFGEASTDFETPNYQRSAERIKNEVDETLAAPRHAYPGEDLYIRTGTNDELWQQMESKPLPYAFDYNLLHASPLQRCGGLPEMISMDQQMQQMVHNSAYYAPVHSLFGLPDQQRDLFQVNPRTGTPIPDDGHVDPTLMTHEQARFKQEYGHTSDPGLAAVYQHTAGASTQVSGQDFKPNLWDNSPTMLPMEHDSEFNKWYGD